ncbi:hypothetical protein V1523DRAFT_422518 [Lipomyces doorenjongii]
MECLFLRCSIILLVELCLFESVVFQLHSCPFSSNTAHLMSQSISFLATIIGQSPDGEFEHRILFEAIFDRRIEYSTYRADIR